MVFFRALFCLVLIFVTQFLSSAATAGQWNFIETEKYCAAAVENEGRTIFGLRHRKGSPLQSIFISAFNSNWNIPFSRVRVVAETHGSKGTGKFNVDANVRGGNSLDLGGVQNPDALIGGIVVSDLLLLKYENGEVFASFSLKGSKDAYFSMLDCAASNQ